MIVRDNKFESDGGQHSLQMEQVIMVKQLYYAIKKAVKANTGEFDIKTDDLVIKKLNYGHFRII